MRFGSGQFVMQLLGLRLGIVQRCLGLGQGSSEHRLPLFRAFAPHLFRRKALLQSRDQFTEGHNLVGLCLGARVGATLRSWAIFSVSLVSGHISQSGL